MEIVVHILLSLIVVKYTVNREIFDVQIFSNGLLYPKIKSTKIFRQRKFTTTRVAECLLAPVTVQCIVPPHRKNSERNFDNFRGKCPTTTPPLVMATEYRSAALWGSL